MKKLLLIPMTLLMGLFTVPAQAQGNHERNEIICQLTPPVDEAGRIIYSPAPPEIALRSFTENPSEYSMDPLWEADTRLPADKCIDVVFITDKMPNEQNAIQAIQQMAARSADELFTDQDALAFAGHINIHLMYAFSPTGATLFPNTGDRKAFVETNVEPRVDGKLIIGFINYDETFGGYMSFDNGMPFLSNNLSTEYGSQMHGPDGLVHELMHLLVPAFESPVPRVYDEYVVNNVVGTLYGYNVFDGSSDPNATAFRNLSTWQCGLGTGGDGCVGIKSNMYSINYPLGVVIQNHINVVFDREIYIDVENVFPDNSSTVLMTGFEQTFELPNAVIPPTYRVEWYKDGQFYDYGESITMTAFASDPAFTLEARVVNRSSSVLDRQWLLPERTATWDVQPDPNAVATAVLDIEVLNVKVYPNPATTFITVDPHDNIGFADIINVNGQLMDSFPLSAQKQKHDISPYAAGTYFLRATIDEDMIVYQFLVK